MRIVITGVGLAATEILKFLFYLFIYFERPKFLN